MSPSKPKPSVVATKVAKLEELLLYNSKLRFCPEQLQNLNYLFHKKLEKKTEPLYGLCLCVIVIVGIDMLVFVEKSMLLAKSVAERLVQRLICCAGTQDARFASKFLISCNNFQVKSICFVAFVLLQFFFFKEPRFAKIGLYC